MILFYSLVFHCSYTSYNSHVKIFNVTLFFYFHNQLISMRFNMILFYIELDKMYGTFVRGCNNYVMILFSGMILSKYFKYKYLLSTCKILVYHIINSDEVIINK